MSPAVSNTSPLHYLALLDATPILPSFAQRVWISPIVEAELAHPRAPEAVRRWISAPPRWLEVQDLSSGFPRIDGIDDGEASAIALALATAAPLLFMDDAAGRAAARQRGLRVIGVVGLLEVAASRGLIDLADCFRRLLETNFRVAPSLLAEVLRRSQSRGT